MGNDTDTWFRNDNAWRNKMDIWGPNDKETTGVTESTKRNFNLWNAAVGLIIAFALNTLWSVLVIVTLATRDAQTEDVETLLTYFANNTESITKALTSGWGLVISLATLWAGLAGYPLWVSWKTCRGPVIDFRLVFLKRDWAWGAMFAVLFRVFEFIAANVATKFGLDLTGSDNASFIKGQPLVWTIVLVMGAAIGAPIVEEIYFRGALLRSIRNSATVQHAGKRTATVIAIVLSSVIFGSMHASSATTGGAFLVGMTGMIGASLAIISLKTDRLGINIWAHVWFNLSGVLMALTFS
jgi:uncharacterized protein